MPRSMLSSNGSYENFWTVSSNPVIPKELRTKTDGARLNATICNSNPNLVIIITTLVHILTVKSSNAYL